MIKSAKTMKKAIILIGPPGAGKGTQSSALQDALFLRLIQPGVLLRRQVSRETEIGKKIAPILKKGHLVSDQIVNRIVFRLLKRDDRDVLLDGYPRNLEQAKKLHDFLADNDFQTYIFEIKLAREIIIERISGRRSCSCGATYHVLFDPPSRKGYCDHCKKKLVVRSDSRPSVVARRLDVYEKQTRPIIAYFKRQKGYRYSAVSGEWPKEKINKFILKKIS